MRLKNKVAVVTGAAQGIGLACAERFQAEGAKLMLSDINEAGGQEAAARLKAPFIRADAGTISNRAASGSDSGPLRRSDPRPRDHLAGRRSERYCG